MQEAQSRVYFLHDDLQALNSGPAFKAQTWLVDTSTWPVYYSHSIAQIKGCGVCTTIDRLQAELVDGSESYCTCQ